MAAEAAAQRQARILVVEKGSDRAVRVLHPGKLTPEDMKRIDDVLVNKVIKELTGCSCLSGVHDVIWERDFARVLDVQLGPAAQG
jgi:flavin-dependent dehydrogenase